MKLFFEAATSPTHILLVQPCALVLLPIAHTMTTFNTLCYVSWMYLLLGFLPVRWMVYYASGDSNSAEDFCPKGCTCQGTVSQPKVNCSDRNLTSLPKDIRLTTTHLWVPKLYCTGCTRYMPVYFLLLGSISWKSSPLNWLIIQKIWNNPHRSDF